MGRAAKIPGVHVDTHGGHLGVGRGAALVGFMGTVVREGALKLRPLSLCPGGRNPPAAVSAAMVAGAWGPTAPSASAHQASSGSSVSLQPRAWQAPVLPWA